MPRPGYVLPMYTVGIQEMKFLPMYTVGSQEMKCLLFSFCILPSWDKDCQSHLCASPKLDLCYSMEFTDVRSFRER